MLGLGLMLFCVRGLMPGRPWRTGALGFSFWAINIGLLLMVALSLSPVGMMQTWAAVEHGTWYARSAEFLQTPTTNTLRWMRVLGDTIFAVGVLAIGRRTRRSGRRPCSSPPCRNPPSKKGDFRLTPAGNRLKRITTCDFPLFWVCHDLQDRAPRGAGRPGP